MKATAQPGRILGMMFLTAFLLVSCAHRQRHEWPVIEEMNVRHHFAANRESEQLKTMIRDLSGKPLHCLDARFCWRFFDDERDYGYSGTLDCRLYPVGAESHYPTVLMNDVNATRDWQTYGRFTDEELLSL